MQKPFAKNYVLIIAVKILIVDAVFFFYLKLLKYGTLIKIKYVFYFDIFVETVTMTVCYETDTLGEKNQAQH